MPSVGLTGSSSTSRLKLCYWCSGCVWRCVQNVSVCLCVSLALGCSAGLAGAADWASLQCREQFQPAHSCGHNTVTPAAPLLTTLQISRWVCKAAADIFGKVAYIALAPEGANRGSAASCYIIVSEGVIDVLWFPMDWRGLTQLSLTCQCLNVPDIM